MQLEHPLLMEKNLQTFFSISRINGNFGYKTEIEIENFPNTR